MNMAGCPLSATADQRQHVLRKPDALLLVGHEGVEPDRMAHLDLVPDILDKYIGDPAVTVEGPDGAGLIAGRFHQRSRRAAHRGMADERADRYDKLVPEGLLHPLARKDRGDARDGVRRAD